MLIRTQNRKAIVNLENISSLSAESTWSGDEYAIYAYTNATDTPNGENIINLGCYDSMERCIEILDEIQNAYSAMLLSDSQTIRMHSIQGATVYKMPEK